MTTTPTAAITTIADDSEYEVAVIDRVEEEETGYAIRRADGFSFFVPKEHGVRPAGGDIARFYGRGIGSIVRGLALVRTDARSGETRLIPVFYRTPAEQEEKNRQELAEREAEQKRRFADSVMALNRDYDALPAPFQKRLDILRANNPDFRWKHEAYEMFACTEAVKIAAACASADEVRAFASLPYAKQQRRVPELSEDHSGNTFGAACRFAWLYLTDAELVWKEHGALCPLVGCEEYGCWITTQAKGSEAAR